MPDLSKDRNDELGMACVWCGQTEVFHVCCDIWGELTKDGFDSDADNLPNRDADFDDYRGCRCPQCGAHGVVGDFRKSYHRKFPEVA